MTWQTERSKSGKRPWQWIEIEIDRCALVYGESPCGAELGVTGSDKCFNGWQTCQDRLSFTSQPFFIRFGEPVADLPRLFTFTDDGLDNFLPFLRAVRHSPSMPDPGESLGVRAQLSVELTDAPHHDIGIDKYQGERGIEQMLLGQFFQKLKARFPHYIGRRLRWYQGYITDTVYDPDNPSAFQQTTLSDFRRREYIMERFEGPDANGSVRIIAKDVLKLLDDDRAQAPSKSSGELAENIAASGASGNLDLTTEDATEYDLKPGEATDWVRIGAEVFSYTGTTVIAGGVRLTGVTRNDPPGSYRTTEEAHEIGDAVQRCRYFSGTIPEVVRELMVDYGPVDPAFINISEWADEAATWLAQDDIERLITEPEGVRSIINEIIGQTLTWGFWFDEIDQMIRFRAIRPADVTDDVQEVTDSGNLVAGTFQIADDPEFVRNEVQLLYGQIDPTKSRDEFENYRRGHVVVDTDSQSENEIGQRRIKRVMARWIPTASTAVALRFAERTLSSRSKNLINVTFELERKDEGIRTADFCDLTTIYIRNELGLSKQTRVQVLQSDSSDERIRYRAREDFFKLISNFGRWAPASLRGVDWDYASDDDRERYMAWCQPDGTFTNGDEGKRWS